MASLTTPSPQVAERDTPCPVDGRDAIRQDHGEPGVFRPHFMLVPSLACPAECSYCFGPHHGPTMPSETMEAALDFVASIVRETGQRKVKVTFHGGEPLMAGHAIWRQALEGLASRFGPRGCELALQSNLWLLDDEFCRLFREHDVDVGTSLDGPREITDHQRGIGYFDRTTAGIRKAQSHGITVGCIATFTPFSAPRWREVFDFFLAERLGFSIHASVPPLTERASAHSILADEYGRLLREMLGYYVEHRREISVSSLDQMCRAVGCGEGTVCTLKDCLGMFLAIDPDGDIFPCQRLCGQREYRMGSLADRPRLVDLLDSPVAGRMAARQEQVSRVCEGCRHVDYCRGGCTYNAWAAENPDTVRDPYCSAYRGLFDHIQNRLLEEMATEENIAAVAARPFSGKGNLLLKKGPLIDLVREGRHPRDVARTAKRIVAAVELARGPDIPAVAIRLVKMGICRTQQSGEASLNALRRRLQPRPGALNNLYLHLTLRCQLECTHCYARADATGRQQKDMPIDALASLVRQAKEASFRQVILTGGEPLVHHERSRLLETLTDARGWAAPMNLVLRTNLAMPLSWEDLTRIAEAVDQVVVSVDGSRETHDSRRGKGTYDAVVRNLEAYADIARSIPDAGELSLAAVMRSTDIQGEPGEAVRQLAARLNVRRTRFRPLLPIGRAKDWAEPPTSEALGGHAEPMDLIEAGFHPVSTCGLGQNLYVEPSGESFPCYAYHKQHAYLGNVVAHGLRHLLDSEQFGDLSCHNVDTNTRCKTCESRYLCGGACRAWGGRETQFNLGAAPPDCTGLRSRARRLRRAAGEYLELDNDRDQDKCSSG